MKSRSPLVRMAMLAATIFSFVFVLALLAEDAFANDHVFKEPPSETLRPPVAVTLRAGVPLDFSPTIPVGNVERDIFVTYRGFIEENFWPGKRDCRYRTAIGSGHWRTIIVAWHDNCGARPKIRLLSATDTVRVSLHVWYRTRRNLVDVPADEVILTCGVDEEATPAAKTLSRLLVPLLPVKP